MERVVTSADRASSAAVTHWEPAARNRPITSDLRAATAALPRPGEEGATRGIQPPEAAR